MSRALLIAVRFLDGRYHGVGDWPPAPARVFQAMIAGAAEGASIPAADRDALAWLEGLPPPDIAAPPGRVGQAYKSFVPNNDLDAKGGDPGRVAEIRAPKQICPRLFDPEVPLLYLWRFDEGEEQARRVAQLTERLYQLGRGVDSASATAEALDAGEAAERLSVHGGAIYRPAGGDGLLLACPVKGSLESLVVRHSAMTQRLKTVKVGRGVQEHFSQPPRARFAQVAYNGSPELRLYDLRDLAVQAEFYSWPLREVAHLAERVRDRTAARLRTSYGIEQAQKASCVERVFGLCGDANQADKSARIRITPLPSIGHAHTDPAIRRILVEVPLDCPLPSADVAWAFAGLGLAERIDSETGEVVQDIRLIEAEDHRMAGHYGIGGREKFAVWRTVTPAALPERPAHRRIDPGRRAEEAKGAAERLAEEARAQAAVRQALRHTEIASDVAWIRVQREPFHAKGARAEAFSPGTRFSKHRLWHVEIRFEAAREGPVVIGDGRYLGLGIMAPETEILPRAAVFAVEGGQPSAESFTDILGAVRRALMALDRDLDGNGKVSTLFSGHRPDGRPAGDGAHRHVFLAAAGDGGDERPFRLYVIRPDAADRRARLSPAEEARFERVITLIRTVRAGRHGIINLVPLPGTPTIDPILIPAQIWESSTVYRPTRHASRGRDPAAAVVQDVITECGRRGLPMPEVDLLELVSGPKGGRPAARIRLRFAVAVEGPIILGRDSHSGGGLFIAAEVGGDSGCT